MQRRAFILKMMAGAALLQIARLNPASAQTTAACREDLKGQGIVGSSMGFFEIRHQHEFFIPLNVLVRPPAEGYSARSTSPLKGKSDLEGLRHRTDNSGAPLDLSQHAHTVMLTQEQLVLLSQGRHLTVDLAKFGHQFYFVADDATLAKIQELKARL